MKKLLILLFIFSFLATQAQDTIDSSRVSYFRNANTVYREVSAFPVGQVADSIDYFETGGVKFQRLDSRSTVYDMQALRIYANGSNMRVLLQRVLNNPRITGIKLDQFGGGVIDITGGTVDFNGKRLISYGGTILKPDSVCNVAIYAPADVQVFDSTTRAGNVVSGIFSVSPKWFGAKGNGVNDDTKAVQKAFNLSDVIVKFPGGNYYTTDSLTLHWSNSIEMPSGSLIVSNTTNKPGIVIGSYSDAYQTLMRGKTYSVRIKRSTQSDWTDTASIGVKFVNVNHSKVTDIDASYFTIGMKSVGYNAGVTGMEYRLGFFERNMVDIWVTTANPSELAWNNENKYYGGYLRNGSENSGKQTFGVWLGGGGYSVTNNIFTHQSIEKRSNAIPFLLIQASRNKGDWFRSEGNSDTTVKILANGTSNNDNDFYAGRDGGVGKIYDYSAYKRNYYNSADRIGTNKSDFTTITEATNLGDMASYSGSDSSVSIAWPALFLMRDDAYPRNTAIGPVIGDGAIIFRGSVRGAVITDFIDVSKLKKLAIKVNITDTTTSSTFLIKMYDKYGHLLGNDVQAGIGLTMSYSTSFGGSWLGTFTAFDQFPVVFPDTVKKVIIGFGKTQASGNAGIKNYKITSYEAGASSVATVYNNRGAGNTSPTIPTIGSYMLGQQIMNSNPKKDSAYGWVCTSSGTFGPPLTGVKATYANNSNVVILNSGSGAKLSVGEWLQIGANPTKILGISGDSLFLGNRTFGTLSDGDISYAVPTFEVITKIAQTGGSGGSGETNTASNYGAGGIGVYDSKNGVDLRLRNINAGSNKVSVTLDNTNHEVDVDVNPANLTGIPQSGVAGLAAALDSLRKNDTLHYDIYRGVGGSKADSLYVEFFDTTYRVFAPVGGGGSTAWGGITGTLSSQTDLQTALNAKQATLVSGTNIKTFDGLSMLGSGDNDITVAKNSTRDSIIITIGSNRYAVKDSIGTGGATLPTKPSGYLLAGTGSAGYDSTGLYWDKVNSRFGIGTSVPTGKVHIKSAGGVNSGLLTESTTASSYATTDWKNDAGTTAQMLMAGSTFNNKIFTANTAIFYSGGAGVTIGSSSATGVLKLFTGGIETTNERLRISASGDVGIGTTTPTEVLHVNGNIRGDFASGTAGTDSLVVVSGGVLKRIAANYYSTGGGGSGVTSVSAGNGMSFSTITGTGPVVLGTPSNITMASTNSATSGTHTHAFVPGGTAAQIIRGNGTLSDAIGNGYVKFSTATNQYTASNLIPYSDISSPPTIPDVTNGDYKPTIAAEFATLNSSTIDTFSYTKIGDKVHAWGQITVTTNTDALTGQSIYITLPFASTFTDEGQLTGAGAARKSATPTPLSIQAVNYSGVGYAEVSFNRTSGSSETFVLTITFDYKIRAGGD